MFYEVKARIEKENSKGELKKIAEHYIVDGCEFFGEAEQRILMEYSNECDVFSVVRSKIIEIINQKELDKPFFKATVVDIFTDDDGEEKETKNFILVCAKNVTEATKIVEEHLKQGYDSRLEGIVKTKILDLL
jgi:hypothetical protein